MEARNVTGPLAGATLVAWALSSCALVAFANVSGCGASADDASAPTGSDEAAQAEAELVDLPFALKRFCGAEGIDIEMWRGLVAPAGTPDDVIMVLQDAAEKAVASEEFLEAAKTLGFEPDFRDHAAFGALIARDDATIAALMDGLGLKTQ